jgi:hypothetical protein
MDVALNHPTGAGHPPRVVTCAPRRSGMTRLQLVLMGQGVARTFRLRGRAEEKLDVKALMQPGFGR